jgi:hypothetical protein
LLGIAPTPTVHIGPDVSMRGLCGTTTQAAVASVDERGEGVTQWSLSVRGDPAFVVSPGPMRACQLTGASVGFVLFTPAPDKLPGQTFDAVVSVHADDGSFADGTVNVHAEIVAPQITVDTRTIDFGDVPALVQVRRTVNFSAPAQDVSLVVERGPDLEFSVGMALGVDQKVAPSLHSWSVMFISSTLGDHSTSMTWTAFPAASPSAAAACTWSATIDMHARVVADDAGGSDGADGGSDGGAASPMDGP